MPVAWARIGSQFLIYSGLPRFSFLCLILAFIIIPIIIAIPSKIPIQFHLPPPRMVPHYGRTSQASTTESRPFVYINH
jgi:hypothetical protein